MGSKGQIPTIRGETDDGSSLLSLIEGKDLVKKKGTLVTNPSPDQKGRIMSKTTAIGDDHQKLQRPQSIHGFDTEMEDEFESEEDEEEADQSKVIALHEGGDKESDPKTKRRGNQKSDS